MVAVWCDYTSCTHSPSRLAGTILLHFPLKSGKDSGLSSETARSSARSDGHSSSYPAGVILLNKSRILTIQQFLPTQNVYHGMEKLTRNGPQTLDDLLEWQNGPEMTTRLLCGKTDLK